MQPYPRLVFLIFLCFFAWGNALQHEPALRPYLCVDHPTSFTASTLSQYYRHSRRICGCSLTSNSRLGYFLARSARSPQRGEVHFSYWTDTYSGPHSRGASQKALSSSRSSHRARHLTLCRGNLMHFLTSCVFFTWKPQEVDSMATSGEISRRV